jgi:heme/copper-type cytochrome/quinol oxidase subunit 2
MFLRTHRPAIWLVVALALLVAAHSLADACPTCKDTLEANDPQRANLVRGYFYSIIFMLSMPFLIFTGLCGYFYYEVRKARRTKQQTCETPLPATGSMRQLPAS